MKYGHSQLVGDEGFAAVQLIVTRTVRWIFRQVTGPDLGIDAVVEQVTAGKATGRWVSIQIKSGVRYFDERTNDGIVFRDTIDHLEYYRQHQLPVIVTLHDPDTDKAFWEAVRPETVTETGAGWKLVVPYRQVITAATGADWARVHGRRTREPPAAWQPEINLIDGSLATIHDLLQKAEEEVLVSAPFLSVDLFSLLDFLATKLMVRIITSNSTLTQPLLRDRSNWDHLQLRVANRLHAKFLLVDRTTVCITSASFTQRGLSGAREVLVVDRGKKSVDAALSQFQQIWMNSIAKD